MVSTLTILGKRVDLSLVGAEAREQAMQALRAREILYRKAKEICGMAPAPGLDAGRLYCPMQLRGIDTETQSRPAQSANSTHGVVQPLNGDEDCPGGVEIPSVWFEPPFWTDTWIPVYRAAPRPPDVECVTSCQAACDVIADGIDVLCGVAGLVAGSLATPVTGGLVATACVAGSFVGKYYCKLVECQTICRPR